MSDAMDHRHIRPDMREALDAWNDGSGPYVGNFLRAVLSNDLMGAIGLADSHNLATLPAIVSYVYNVLRGDNHGSRDAVQAWADKHITRLRAEQGEVTS